MTLPNVSMREKIVAYCLYAFFLNLLFFLVVVTVTLTQSISTFSKPVTELFT